MGPITSQMEPLEEIHDEDYAYYDSDSIRGSDSSDEEEDKAGHRVKDDFEAEMMGELSNKLDLAQDSMFRDGPSTSKEKDDDPDDLFYDEDQDEDNERWAAEKRRKVVFAHLEEGQENSKKLPDSDAALNCPACMTLLCTDCQRHEVYNTQYRAMFVQNCRVDETVKLKCPLKKEKKNRARPGGSEDELYSGVFCSICNTQVAVFDDDEVYHFFNVVASHC